MDEVTGERRKLHNKKLYALYSPSLKKTEMGRTCGTYGERCTENLREGDHLKDPGADGRIILKWIFDVGCGRRLDRSGSV
jgi:hypothetical protein